MAALSVYVSSPHRLCLAQARPSSRNLRRNTPKKLPRNPNPGPNTRISSDDFPAYKSGGDATTYIRLPPKEDFVEPSLPIPTEVRLSDLAKSEENEYVIDGSSSEEEVFDEIPGFDYGELEESDGSSASDEVSGLEDEGLEVKEKGVPAVMRCFDSAKIYVKAGDGGNGVVAFRREKYVPLGGPSGGDGGRGGSVFVEVDGSMNSLLPFRKSVHFRAGRGHHGQGRKQDGAKGEDVVVKVAPGTVIREAGEGELLLELLYPGQRALLLHGGRGGRGNASFKSGTNKVPKIAERGEEGAEM